MRWPSVCMLWADSSRSPIKRNTPHWPLSRTSSKAQAGGQVGTATIASRDAPLSAVERQEPMEPRRKLRRVHMERDIFAKATAWVANNGEQTYTPSTR